MLFLVKVLEEGLICHESATISNETKSRFDGPAVPEALA